ncbi:hypothetical protein DEU34_2522 [Microbacterium sp. AG1240]|nr:hypothetical protein DEU34_2522 [Microbacterium sp. AG1240]
MPRSFRLERLLRVTGRGRPSKYPMVRLPATGKLHAATDPIHGLWSLARKLRRDIDRIVYADGLADEGVGASEPGLVVPAVWEHEKWGTYNLVRFILAYLPPRPDANHYVRIRLDDDGRVRLYWCAFKEDSVHRAAHFLVFTCCNAMSAPQPFEWSFDGVKGPFPPSWGKLGFDLPREGEPETFVWRPEALPGDPSFLPAPVPLVAETEREVTGPSLMNVYREMYGHNVEDSFPGAFGVEGVVTWTENEPLTENRRPNLPWLRDGAPEGCLCPTGSPSPDCWLAYRHTCE